MTRDHFDRMFESGSAALRTGDLHVEVDPATSGRWGPSAVLRPAGDVADVLASLTDDVLAVAGAAHRATGSLGAAHFTVRALQPFGVLATNEQVAALRRAVDGPVRFDLAGLTLDAGGVYACATSPDGAADRLRERYADELGTEGWLEADALPDGRDPVWYATLVHFAGAILEPIRVLEWVAHRRSLPIGDASFDAVEVCRWDFDGRRMAPTAIASVALTPV